MTKRERIFYKYNGLCAYTGKPLGKDWQIDHLWPKRLDGDNNEKNLVPAIKIINHYKRAHTLETFRLLMSDFHVRLKKLPKKTKVEATKKRIIYMNEVARLFDITTEKPFDGKFYFENYEQ